MTLLKLLLRNLLYFRGTNLAVVAGVAVATAVLTGALMVGDSMRGSLRQLAEQRLGPVDHMVTGPLFFRADLAARLKARPEFAREFTECVPGIVVRGRAANEDGTARVAGVQVLALGGAVDREGRGKAILNANLARSLMINGAGADMTLSMANSQTTPRDAPLAQRSSADAVVGLRARVVSIAPDDSFLGLFDMSPSQREPRNAWVDLADLQRAVSQPEHANLLLISGSPASTALSGLLKQVMTLDDYGLTLTRPTAGAAMLTSRSTYLMAPVESAAVRAAKASGVELNRIATHLLGNVERAGSPDKTLHYVIAAGVDVLDGGVKLQPDEAAVNAWTSEQLGLKVGDKISFTYFARGPDGLLRDVPPTGEHAKFATLRIAAILPMTGLGAEPSLTPEYKGFTDAKSVHDWQPPEDFPFNRDLVTAADEKYWDNYHAAPKVFLNVQTAQTLWGERFGGITSIRIPADQADAFAAAMGKELSPADVGIVAAPVRAQQLAAAGGSTDFAVLFVSFSFFLIIAAVMLVALLFRLGVEQRARQLGLLGALGFTPGVVFRGAVAEGLVLAFAGGLIGLVGAAGYTWLMVAGLRTWWIGATGTRHLHLFIEPATLAMGLAASVIVAVAAMAWSVRHVRKMPAAGLLAGRFGSVTRPGRGALWRRIVAVALGVAGLGCIIAGMVGAMSAQEAFLSGGGMLLIACLSGLSALWRGRPRRLATRSITALALRNGAARPTRSALTVGLVGFASFILVTVGAMQQGPGDDPRKRPSGTGGYALLLTADVPLLGDLNTVAGRKLVGIKEPQAAIWSRPGLHFTNLRVWQGQDISCLNMMRPSAPRILGVPDGEIAGRFVTAQPAGKNALTLIQPATAQHDPVPVAADGETAEYILHLELGSTLPQTDQLGRDRSLRLAATLEGSIFQSELLMGENNFEQLFPMQSGYGMVLIDTPASGADDVELTRILQTDLEEYGVTVESTGARLAAFKQVANTYLATFQALGSLGLLLGTVGMAIVLLRNLLERRAELALLEALGFDRKRRSTLVLRENAALLFLGLAVGTLCALIGVLPSLRAINLTELILTLAIVALFGLLCLTLVLRIGRRWQGAAALRQE